MDEKMELIIMNLVVSGGNARSLALQAVKASREKQFEEAAALMEQCNQALDQAHCIQTELIQKEANGEYMEVRLLMVHAQDHLMNAMTVRDIAVEMIAMNRERAEGM